jgi:hypothetical protein
MTEPLSPCASCARHVRVTERACPFCSAARTPALAAHHLTEEPSGLSRAALLVLGASLALAAGCERGTAPNSQPTMVPRPPAASEPSSADIYGAPPRPTPLTGPAVPAYGMPAPPGPVAAAYGTPPPPTTPALPPDAGGTPRP